jgi:hypothetical protein
MAHEQLIDSADSIAPPITVDRDYLAKSSAIDTRSIYSMYELTDEDYQRVAEKYREYILPQSRLKRILSNLIGF